MPVIEALEHHLLLEQHGGTRRYNDTVFYLH